LWALFFHCHWARHCRNFAIGAHGAISNAWKSRDQAEIGWKIEECICLLSPKREKEFSTLKKNGIGPPDYNLDYIINEARIFLGPQNVTIRSL
jgi:hypothetical protein